METQHAHSADVSFDGGDLDCGSGLLLLIRRHIDPLAAGQTLEILSTDSTVEVDLPAWCRMTGNDLLSLEKRTGNQNEQSTLATARTQILSTIGGRDADLALEMMVKTRP